MTETQNDYSKTVLLPRTDFPMKAGLAQSEPERVAKWERERAYWKLQERRKGRPRWVLHDGPPFANGDIHMGTALNKILKDLCVRYRAMRGFEAPFVPGWDCHGMPIEYKVVKALGPRKAELTPLQIRRLCAQEAAAYVERQRAQFKRLGVWADWERPYLTMDPAFEAAQLDVYWKLLQSGQIYRGLKPVHWCVHDQTALAEAELEYRERVSTSVYAKFELEPESAARIAPGRRVFAVIWTTTPWTLPANLAISANEKFDYGAYESRGELWLVACDLAGSLGCAGEPVWRGKGAELESLWARHPFVEGRRVRFCLAPYVTLDAGTGLVHTAPGHGGEDFATGSRYGLEVFCPVDASGRYTDAFPLLKGRRVTDAETDAAVVELLRQHGALVREEPLSHSYPHCWRCKQPIIFRATQQWFLSLERNRLRDKALEAIAQVQWLNRWGAERLSNMIRERSDWCISRQRSWGVPIYVFFCSNCKEPHFDEACYRKVRALVEQEGSDPWFDPSRPLSDFLPPGAVCGKCGGTSFERGQDTLDVWFDSGSTSSAVLMARPELAFPADLYLEASDQYRGWFQSSLLVSVGVHGKAPYKAVLSSGWMLDAQGRPMHKSLGNAVDPMEVMKTYGADILRLWMISEDVREDLRLSEEILKSVAESYRRLRNSYRWLLGNLHGFDPTLAPPLSRLQPLDRWLLAQLSKLVEDCTAAMEACEFQRFYSRYVGFCTSELSALFFDVHKDTLYTLSPRDERRLSAQAALYQCLQVLVKLIAPVLCFTAEEVWEHMPPSWREAESVHFALWPEAVKEWRDEELEADFEVLLKALMPPVKKRLEEARAAKLIGHPYDARLRLRLHSKQVHRVARRYAGLLARLFIVSEVELLQDAPRDGLQVEPSEIEVEASPHRKCARCWRRPGDVPAEGGICGRCRDALSSLTTTA